MGNLSPTPTPEVPSRSAAPDSLPNELNNGHGTGDRAIAPVDLPGAVQPTPHTVFPIVPSEPTPLAHPPAPSDPALARVKALQAKSRRWLSIGAIALVSLGAIGAGFWAWGQLRAAQTPVVDLDKLTVLAKPADLTLRIDATGTLRPVQTVNLSPKTAGRVAALYVEQGDRVVAGQMIAKMDDREILVRRAQARAALARVQARLRQLESGNRAEDIAEAAARVERSRAELANVQARLGQLQAGNRPQEIAEAQARINRAQAEVNSARARLSLAQVRLRRNQSLADEGAIARDTFDNARQEERTAQADLERTQAGLIESQKAADRIRSGSRPQEIDSGAADVARAKATLAESQSAYDRIRSGNRPEDIASARADVAEARAALALVETQLEDTVVRAPYGGFISQKYADVGAFVTPTTSASTGSGATSTSLAALARDLEVLARVPEVDIGEIRVGQTVEVTADAYPDRTFRGRVKLVAPEAVRDRDVTYFEVRVDLLDGLDVLRSGMNANLVFLGSTVSNALVVPTVAVVTVGGDRGVLIPDEKKDPLFRPVTTGPTIGDRIQILKGIQAGDRVFINLPPGKKLEDLNPKKPRGRRPS